MVGYIDDAIIESQVRVRFEVGLGNHAPDRAEFFYAKCGCYRDLDKFPGALQFFDPNAPGPGPDVLDDLDFRQFMVEAEYAVNQPIPCSARFPCGGFNLSTLPIGPTALRRSDLAIKAGSAICEPARRWPSRLRPTTP